MNSYELRKSNSQIYTLLSLNSKCVCNRQQLHPSLACHAQFYKDKQTTSVPHCLSFTAAALLGPESPENGTLGRKVLSRPYACHSGIRNHADSNAKSYGLLGASGN